MKDGYLIQSPLIEMRIATTEMATAFENVSFVMGIAADHLPELAIFISRHELDRAYFAAGGLSDLAMMQGQPF